MKTTKTIITALFLLFSALSFAQNNEEKEYYDSGKVKMVTTYKNGVKDGPVKGYYENGNTQLAGNFKNGKLQGKLTTYSEDGTLSTIENYLDDQLDGEAEEYDENGKLYSTLNFKNGVQHGKTTTYFKNKIIESVTNYVNGELHGERKAFYPSGKIKFVENYENDDKIGNTVYYYENGQQDTRTDELQALLKEHLIPNPEYKKYNNTITRLNIMQSAMYIYFTDNSSDPKKYLKVPHNIKEIDKDGIMRFHGYDVKLKFEYRGQYISSTEASYFSEFIVKKEGRKKIEELMKSLANSTYNNL